MGNRAMNGLLGGLVLALMLGTAFWYVLPWGGASGGGPDTAASFQPPIMTSTDGDREAQRQRAMDVRDPALLPLCTEVDLTNRPDPVPAKSMEPWDHPAQLGCHLPPPLPDDMELGPRSGPAPPEPADSGSPPP